MPADILFALIGFAFVTSLTPGPNNIMLLSSGVNYGFRRTIPHMLGIVAGFPLMLIAVGLGLGQILERAPQVFVGLKIVGGIYLLYLAWKIANAGGVDVDNSNKKPFTFVEAAAFQWVNPKSWVAAISAITVYSDTDNYLQSVFWIGLVFFFAALASVTTWTGFGTGLRTFLSKPKTLRIFNIAMALLLVASLWPMLR
ncbi:MAG: LysE family translocator [Rhizobiaceae bacterium]|nr:LysE family translocator [Rhizobiaceae bacterium]